MSGTWWGLVPILLAKLLLVDRPTLVFGPTIVFVPWGLLLFLYGLGAVLLFGGTRLLRAALAPLCLLLLINPVPHWYTSFVDAPLQEISAITARAFAHAIGLHPSGEQLRLMFAPDFGMMIVPGCNGVRGSVTLATLALIFGYLRGLRRTKLLGVVVVSLLTGFLLNFLRLCLLVVYCRIGLAIPNIKNFGTQVDYAIGGTIFLLATIALNLLILRLAALQTNSKQPAPTSLRAKRSEQWLVVVKSVALITFAVVVAVSSRRAMPAAPEMPLKNQDVATLLPMQVGEYRLINVRTELLAGKVAFAFGDYARNQGQTARDRITLGLWLSGPSHYLSESKSVQGVRANWFGGFDERVLLHEPDAHFITSAYSDGDQWQMNAESICSLEACSAGAKPLQRWLHIARPRFHMQDLTSPQKRLPVMLRREERKDAVKDIEEAERNFEQDARVFLAHLELARLVALAGSEV